MFIVLYFSYYCDFLKKDVSCKIEARERLRGGAVMFDVYEYDGFSERLEKLTYTIIKNGRMVESHGLAWLNCRELKAAIIENYAAACSA